MQTRSDKSHLPESSLLLNHQPDFLTLEELSVSVLAANSMTTNAAARRVKTFSGFLENEHLTQKPSGKSLKCA